MFNNALLLNRKCQLALFGALVVAGCGSVNASNGPDAGAGGGQGADASGPGDPWDPADANTTPSTCTSGHVTYGVNGKNYKMSLATGDAPLDITGHLDAMSAGSDAFVTSSADGKWLLVDTTRFDPGCRDWACLVLVDSDFQGATVIKQAGVLVHSDGFAAVASGGDEVIYVAAGPVHTRDLFKTTRTGTGWSPGLNLTASSTQLYNAQPTISADGSKVVFDCGPVPYGGRGTSICEVGTDGTGLRTVWTSDATPAGFTSNPDNSLHHAAYAPDGSIVFEASWSGEQIWHIVGDGPPTLLGATFDNDNSPCVLPDGCVVSLWLGRREGTGVHELKVMGPDGVSHTMLQTGADISDTGISCGR